MHAEAGDKPIDAVGCRSAQQKSPEEQMLFGALPFSHVKRRVEGSRWRQCRDYLQLTHPAPVAMGAVLPP